MHHRSAIFSFALGIASFGFVGCLGLVSGNNGNPPPPSTLNITNVQATSITTSSAQVVWTTNVPADSSVDYGTTTAYGTSTPVDSGMVTSHQMTLSGLAAGTTYYYQVNSTDSKGNNGRGGNKFNTTGFSISGTINPTAAGSGATVALSGGASASATADSSGNYTFAGLANGSYLVTPKHTGYAFTPGNQSATVNGANVTGVNFTGNAAPVAPSITTQPASQSVTAGQTASFSVAATGTAPLSYQWQKNGASIAGATAASYTTLATTTTDSGSTFAVVVSNTAGTATSSAATLTVNAAAVAPTITTPPANQTVTAGQTATFTVAATGTAPLSYQWRKNGANITGATSASYTTPATTTTDSGSSFVVVVSDTAGTVTSNAATLTVNAPAIQVNPTTISFGNVVVGTNLSQSLIISNSGTATLTITQVTATSTAFSASGFTLPLSVNAGQQTMMTVAFLPTAASTVTGSIFIVSNAPTSPTSVGLSGTGIVATYTLGVSPTSLGFGNVNLGNTSPLSATLTNTGNSNVTISSVTATGTGFSTSGVTPGTILTPSQSAIMNVAFAPLTAGNVTGSVSVVSNATNSPTMIALSGTGVSITGTIYLNRDLSTGDLYQYTHRDWGLGTDVGGNSSGAGFLYHHADVNGRRAAGLTVTPTAQASPAAGSDSVYLWDPVQPWGVSGQEWWLRTSFFFPSSASAALFQPGEAPFQATTGEWNWILELHKDLTSGANTIQFGVMTDYPAVSGQVGTNPRLFLRLAYGNESSPTMIYKEAPALMFDHWYEFLIHVKLDPSSGIAEWFLDGQQLYSNLNVPTLFQRSTGPSSVSLTVPNYRWHAPWSATVYVGPLVIGSTQSIVLNAF